MEVAKSMPHRKDNEIISGGGSGTIVSMYGLSVKQALFRPVNL
jgi:hypothetical protein